MNATLKFSRWNSKMHALAKSEGLRKRDVIAFDLPAGWTCPAATECLSRSDRATGKITDGPATRYRCYAASQEAAFPAARRLRWHNFDALKGIGFDNAEGMALALYESLQTLAPKIVRIHASGDFITPEYLHAWVIVAKAMPSITFYGYTKRADLLPRFGSLPANLRLMVSAGGRYDRRHARYPRAHVVYSVDGHPFPVYTDEQSETACMRNETFGLLIHGTQPKRVNLAVKAAANG